MSTRPRILLLDEPHPRAIAIIKEVAQCYRRTYNGEENSGIYDMFYTQLTPLKVITGKTPVFCPCTGVSHIQAPKIIHLDEQWKANEGKQITSTAEHTFSLILQLAKINRMQLSGKTLGIIGYGRIGQQVEKYAKAFNMVVFKYDTNGAMVYDYIDDLLQMSDIITIHIPLNNETHGMIGENEFSLMKSNALLVNTSRAEIINEEELWSALKNGLISGYADDFYDSHSKQFQEYSGTLMTRHISGNCLEAREVTDIYIANKIVEYIKNPVFTFEYDGL